MNTKTSFNLDDGRLVAQRLAESVGDDLRSVLLFGSAAHGEGHDLDTVIVLRDDADFAAVLPTVRTAIASFNWPIDAHVVRESEAVRRPFSLNTQGTYFLPILQGAVVLHGDNPYLSVTVTPEELTADALRKVQHYVFRARQAAVGCNRTEKPDADRWIKFLRKCSYDILAACGDRPSFREAPRVFSRRWPEVIAPDALAGLEDSSDVTLERVLPFLERLYAAAPRLLNLRPA
jgi:hypothetical protein